MAKHGFNYVDSTVKEMTDFFETRVENLEIKEEAKKSSETIKKKKGQEKRKKRK